MNRYLSYLTERNYSNRTVALVENGSWAPVAATLMKKRFEQSKGIVFADTEITLLSVVKDEDKARLEVLAQELCLGRNGSMSQNGGV